jgi:hypothetical protein
MHDSSSVLGVAWRSGVTYIDNALDGAEHRSNRRADNGHLLQQASLANKDVEKGLVDTDKLAVH